MIPNEVTPNVIVINAFIIDDKGVDHIILIYRMKVGMKKRLL